MQQRWGGGRERCTVLLTVLVVILLVVAAAPAIAAPGTGETGGSVAADEGDTAVEIDSSLADSEGTIEAVVRFPAAEVTAAERNYRQRLRRHAERTQRPFRAFAAETPGVELHRSFWLTNAVVVTVDTDRTPLSALASVEGVRRIHDNYGGGTHSVAGETAGSDAAAWETPNRIQQQSSQTASEGLQQVNAPVVWDFYGARGDGASVAVLDTGVDPSGHPGIADSLSRGGWTEFDPKTGERIESDPYDDDGHGTRLSGLVAGGQTDDGTAYGVAPAADLYHAKVVDDGRYSFASVTAGLEWAIENEVDVVSMSLGPLRYGTEYADPVANARSAGVVVVASIGNAGGDTSATPGNLPTAIGVGAVDHGGAVPQWSGGERIDTARYWGEDAPEGWPETYTIPEVTAPGVDVTVANPGGGYGTAEGASYSTPYVAGVAALVASATDARGETLESTLVASARHPDSRDPFAVDSGRDDRHGAGVVDAMTAISRLRADETLSGVVTTADGEPVAGALVASETGTSTRTDSEGRYTLSVPEGKQPIVVLGVGYRSTVERIDPATTDERDFEVVAADAADAALRESFTRRIDPGETATATFEVAGVDSLTVEADATEPLDTDALTLRVDGQEAEFGQAVSLDAETPRRVTVEIAADSEAPPGSVVPRVRLDGGGESVAGRLDRLYVHETPFRVDPDIPVGLGAPVDILAPGTTIVLADGTYEVGDDGPAALMLDRRISLVAADGADPTLVTASDADTAVQITANDVVVRGLEIDATAAETAIRVGTEATGRESVAPSGVTIVDNRIRGGTNGVVTLGAPALRIERNHVSAADHGIRIADPQRTFLGENRIEGSSVGIVIRGIPSGVTDNSITAAETGILIEVPIAAFEAHGGGFGTIERNTIRDSTAGIRVIGEAPEGAVGDNTFENVDDEEVNVGGDGSDAGGDSGLAAALYASALVSVALLFVPYGVRRFRRR